MFKQLFVSSVSACFELENNSPYYSPEKYTTPTCSRSSI